MYDDCTWSPRSAAEGESSQLANGRLHVISGCTEGTGELGHAVGQEDSTRFYKFLF